MNSYTIENQTDIFSLILSVYGTMEESIQFISDNNNLIDSLDTDISKLAGQIVYYYSALVVTFMPPMPVLASASPVSSQATWFGKEGQNMFDICIQTYGILDNQIKLMSDNNVDFSSAIQGQEYIYDNTLIYDNTIWNRTTGMGIVISTGN